MSASSKSPSPPPASTPPLAEPTTSSTVPADAKLEANAPTGGDADSETSFWDIIADSHPDLESYMDPQYSQEVVSYQPTIDSASLMGSVMLPSPSYYVTVDARPDGTPFPLSKPIAREDGALIVGTELVDTGERNRIFSANFLSSNDPVTHIPVEQEVRDLHWISSDVAVAAVGHDIQLIQLGPLRMQAPISSVHSDAIRELAVSTTTNSYVLSGGFDETVVVSDLRDTGDPTASKIVAKYDARDVVSSVRWSPVGASQVSWTTDGGDFQVADSRVPSPQLQIPLHAYLKVDKLGGLFAHEYLSNLTVALGFESGYVVMLDLRQPRHSACTSLVESKLTAVGEIRRSGSKLAIFGRSGFSTAALDDGRMEHLTLRQQPTQIAATSYKTSGDFTFDSGAHLAVSDNMGIVSVYKENGIFGPSTTGLGNGSGGW